NSRTTAATSIAWMMNVSLIGRPSGQRPTAGKACRSASGDQIVKGIALAWRVSRFANQALDLGPRGAAVGPGGAHHILLDHDAAHVVGAELEGDLADLLALR